jgi:DNA/RNA endonuclease G (NUC1)
MKKSKIEKVILFIAIYFLPFVTINAQNVTTKSTLVIKHPDMTLYLQSDTNTMVSVQDLTYQNYLIINDKKKSVDRKTLNDPWFDDTYKGKFKQKFYKGTKKDLGHLTPFKATSYSTATAINSFSSYNQAPQDSYFNEHPWEQLEQHVLDSIGKYKKDCRILTGVIYNNNKPTYLPGSKIKIPIYYYKILTIGDIRYYWLGDNTPGLDDPISITTLDELNKLFIDNKMDLKISLNIK